MLPSVLVALICAAGYNLYYANLHAHTGYSDGARAPRDAFRYARDTAGIDIQATTDHAEFLKTGQWQDTRVRRIRQ